MIEFGDWQIRRADKLNLTLYHRHAAAPHIKKADGKVGWYATGNYFQSVQSAVEFAVKADMRAAVGTDEERIEMAEWVSRVEEMLADFRNAISACPDTP